jgi:hypothetical protein
VLDPLLAQLKGSDRALADACDELGLRYSLRFLYREISNLNLNLISTEELDVFEETVPQEMMTSDLYL